MNITFSCNSLAELRDIGRVLSPFISEGWIGDRLSTIIQNQEQQMSSEQQLQDTLDTIKADVTLVASAVTTKLADDQQQIAALKAQIAAGSPVSPEQLDALQASAQSSVDLLQPLVDSLSTTGVPADQTTVDAAAKPKPGPKPAPQPAPQPLPPVQATSTGGAVGEKPIGETNVG